MEPYFHLKSYYQTPLLLTIFTKAPYFIRRPLTSPNTLTSPKAALGLSLKHCIPGTKY